METLDGKLLIGQLARKTELNTTAVRFKIANQSCPYCVERNPDVKEET